MATIAIVPSDVASKRALVLRYAARLRAADHRVVLVVGEGADDLAGHEHRILSLRADTDVAIGPWRAIAKAGAVRRAVAAIDVAGFTRLLDEIDTDLVMVDVEEYECAVATLAGPYRERLVTLSSFLDPWPRPGVGPHQAGPAPRTGRVATVVAALRWAELWAHLWVRDLRRHLRRPGIDRLITVRGLVRRTGVRGDLAYRQWVHPFVVRDAPMVLMFAAELDVAGPTRSTVHHVGRLLDPPPTLDDSADAPPGLREFVAEARRLDEALVVCAFGVVMHGATDDLLDRIAEVARRRPRYRFVVATGTQRDASAGLAGLPNVWAAPRIPQRALLGDAAAAIVHSGNATVHECVAAEVPMLVYPFDINDQHRNAAVVAWHRTGVVGDRAGDSAERIATVLDRLIDGRDDAGRTGDRDRRTELAAAVHAYERDGVAVATVEAILESVTGAPGTPR